MIAELDPVILLVDLPDFGLEAGDMGTVVLVHDGGRGYEVEFVALDGTTIAVTSLAADEVRAAGAGEIAHARGLASV